MLSLPATKHLVSFFTIFRTPINETGNCDNGIDDDCDGMIDNDPPTPDPDCCVGEGVSCSVDSDCCGSMPCDNPTEAGSTNCGCPTGYDWVQSANNGLGDCVPRGESCEPPTNPDCDTNPLQVDCLRDTFSPFSSTEACCEDLTYEGTTYYDWSTSYITTY